MHAVRKPKLQSKLTFFIYEKGNILEGTVLTDESINLAQNLLAKQLPGIQTFLDTCLEKMHQFEIIPVSKICIHLLHAGSIYWMYISNLETNKCDNGTHCFYESLCKPKIMLDIVKQFASYLYHDKPTTSLVTITFATTLALVKIYKLSLMMSYYSEPI